MAKLPSGWIFIPHIKYIKNRVTVELEEKRLITCRECKHYRYYGLSEETVSECRIDHAENPDGDWFCADGERKSD